MGEKRLEAINNKGCIDLRSARKVGFNSSEQCNPAWVGRDFVNEPENVEKGDCQEFCA